ncbi:MAG: hypothetical protein OFPI_11890 [Osedax symbiont Rs2]|nr:MAG: hypothetical protein OFPI_11890 [Osedax symbiont Rs2]
MDNEERFSNKVADYVKYRPSYPQALIDCLIDQAKLTGNTQIADIGAGTGIFSKLLLEQGLTVTAVEPNANMLAAAKAQLSDNNRFSYLNNNAEQTGLADQSIDLICAAQAFHWFNTAQSKQEFKRILKPDGYLALIWNQRSMQQPLQIEYDQLLGEFCSDYSRVNHMNLTAEVLASCFAQDVMQQYSFHNHQTFELSGLIGRIQSTSYCPATDSQSYQQLMAAVKVLFCKYQVGGKIRLEYETKLYLGKL